MIRFFLQVRDRINLHVLNLITSEDLSVRSSPRHLLLHLAMIFADCQTSSCCKYPIEKLSRLITLVYTNLFIVLIFNTEMYRVKCSAREALGNPVDVQLKTDTPSIRMI